MKKSSEHSMSDITSVSSHSVDGLKKDIPAPPKKLSKKSRASEQHLRKQQEKLAQRAKEAYLKQIC